MKTLDGEDAQVLGKYPIQILKDMSEEQLKNEANWVCSRALVHGFPRIYEEERDGCVVLYGKFSDRSKHQ